MKVIDGVKYFTLTELGQILDRTKVTIWRWYEYERQLPIEERYLPPLIEMGRNKAKYVSEKDLDKFDQFMRNTKRGDMLKVSHKYNGTVNNEE